MRFSLVLFQVVVQTATEKLNLELEKILKRVQRQADRERKRKETDYVSTSEKQIRKLENSIRHTEDELMRLKHRAKLAMQDTQPSFGHIVDSTQISSIVH